MAGQRVGYVRVSSVDQNVERQLEGIALDRTFTDKASGKDVHRPELEAMVGFVRDGDTVVVHSMDRLARNLDDLRGTVRKLTAKGVEVHFVKERLTFTGEDSAMGTLLLSVMGAFAEFAALLDPGAPARGHSAGQEARRLPGTAEVLGRGPGNRAAPAGRVGGSKGGSRSRTRHQSRDALPVPARRLVEQRPAPRLRHAKPLDEGVRIAPSPGISPGGFYETPLAAQGHNRASFGMAGYGLLSNSEPDVR